MAHIKPTDCYS